MTDVVSVATAASAPLLPAATPATAATATTGLATTASHAAASAPAMGSGLSTGGLVLPVLAFVLIVALIPLALWLLRRVHPGLGGALGRAPLLPMKVIGQLALAPNQRLVAVEVGAAAERRWLVLGVTPGSIQALHTLAPQDGHPADPADTAPMPGPGGGAAADFAQLLGALRRPGGTPRGGGDAR